MSFSPERRASDFQIVLGIPVISRESRGVKGLGRVIGVCSPPPLNTLAGLNQFRTMTLIPVPSTPLHGSATATGGCQECLRESRGDRVMSHDSAPVLKQAPGIVQLFLSCWSSRTFLSSSLRRFFFSVSRPRAASPRCVSAACTASSCHLEFCRESSMVRALLSLTPLYGV